MDGTIYAAGDADVEFTIPSMSKPFTYALALADRGVAALNERVGVEPSGEAFNQISLDPESGRPRNAMINAGAILTHSLVDGEDSAARSERVREGFRRFAGRDLVVDEGAYASELESAHRNLGMAHRLKAAGTLDCDPVEVIAGYTRQCSVTVSCRDLAMMAATRANGGVHPETQETPESTSENAKLLPRIPGRRGVCRRSCSGTSVGGLPLGDRRQALRDRDKRQRLDRVPGTRLQPRSDLRRLICKLSC